MKLTFFKVTPFLGYRLVFSITKIIMIKLITKNMGTIIREEIAITDKNGDVELVFYRNVSGGITITQEDPMEAPYLCVTFTKEDWQQLKEFIDNQF